MVDEFVFFLLVKENIGDLQENLRNVEDKLSAAETCKTMLNEEVLALRQAYDKLSSDLEVSLVILTYLTYAMLLTVEAWAADSFCCPFMCLDAAFYCTHLIPWYKIITI